MATVASSGTAPIADNVRFFLRAAIVMTCVIVAGFSLQLFMGRSSFGAPPIVHAHAVIFMGWVAIYLLQNILAATDKIALHRRLGWVAAGWMIAMILLGCGVTVAMVREGHAPFFFRPQHFIIFNPLSVLTFAGLATAGIIMRHRTDWHRRLIFCGMAILMGPGLGRLLPMPLLEPWAFEATFAASMLFPIAGIISDLRRSGRVHPAYVWGMAVLVGSLLLIETVTYSPIGDAIYRFATAGSPGAAIAPLAFAPPPH